MIRNNKGGNNALMRGALFLHKLRCSKCRYYLVSRLLNVYILFLPGYLLSRAKKKDFAFKFKLKSPTSIDFHRLLERDARAGLVNAANWRDI